MGCCRRCCSENLRGAPNSAVMLANFLPKAKYLEITEKAMKEILGIADCRLRDCL